MSSFRISFSTLLTTILTVALVSPCLAARKHRERPEAKPANIRQARFSMACVLTVGKVTGKASELIGKVEDNITYKLAYGFGLSAEYYIHPRSAIVLSFEPVWKNLPGDDVSSIRTYSYSVSWLYRFSPHSKHSVTVRPQIGLVSATLPSSEGEDLNLDTHPFLRLGLGLFSYTSGRTNTRIELYYKHCFTEGHDVSGVGGGEIGFDAAMIGIELGVGIPLLLR